jgi:hypothetical protein
MKLWLKVLLIGIVLFFLGVIVPDDSYYDTAGLLVAGLGILLIVGSLIALASRIMGRMISE